MIINNKFYVSILAVICTMLWGSAFPAIKLGYKELKIDENDTKNILIFAGIRFFLASILIIVLESLWKKQWILCPKKDLFSISIIGIINTFLQYLFFYIGLVHTEGAKSSVLNSSVTFFTLVLAHFLFREDQLTLRKIIGCFFGIIGVMFVTLNTSETNNNKNSNDISNTNEKEPSFSLLGDGMILLSSICSAVGTVLIKIKNSNNKDELFYTYKNWKIFQFLLHCYSWSVECLRIIFNKIKNGLTTATPSLFRKRQTIYSTSVLQDENILKKENRQYKEIINSTEKETKTLHYPYNFDSFFDKSDPMKSNNNSNKSQNNRNSIESNESIEYFSSLDSVKRKSKSPSSNDQTLRNSYHSFDSKKSTHHTFVYNDYFYNGNENEFEEIEISSFKNKTFQNNSMNSKLNSNENKYRNMNTENKINKDIFTTNEIVDLYNQSNEKVDIMMLTGYQMFIGSLFLNATALLWNLLFDPNLQHFKYQLEEKDENTNTANASLFSSTTLFGYLIIGYMILNTAISFSLWNILIKYNSVGFLSFFNFLIPIFGTLFSGLILHENILTFENLISLILVSFGVIISCL